MKFTKALTAVSGFYQKKIRPHCKFPKTLKFPEIFRRKKKPKVFTFTLSVDDAKKVADTGYTIFEYLYLRKQNTQFP
jgi:hypothetical protein